MEILFRQHNHRLIYPASFSLIGLVALISTFFTDLYKSPAQVVLVSTALSICAFVCVMFSKLSQMIAFKAAIAILFGLTIASMITASNIDQQSLTMSLAFVCTAFAMSIYAQQLSLKLSLGTFLSTQFFVFVGLVVSGIMAAQFIISATLILILSIEYGVVRITHIPVVTSLNEALERAQIISTITKSSREFHSREPEEVIRNIVNVTKTLGYISVSVVSFDRRQKIFEDGVPIPNVMDIAVRASATRRVTITEDSATNKSKRSRAGDIVGIPIWINGRYSAALIVQTSSHTKVTQRDCEALELLADQAGRALENAGKAAMDRRVVERLTDESQRDKLTGLGNRRFADAMVASMKPGDVLAMIDLDGLKNTNDVFGHASGDQLLHEVGVFLADQIRNPDMAARLGGDEFMLLLHNADEGAVKILERLLVMWQDKKLYNTTFSIGMAVHRSGRAPRETVEAADTALYKAKKDGKNRLVCSQIA